ncbi:MAG: hypothetical protein CVU97_06615 [Firmicutes bacterium HGW-Firmicutes-21]|nr:MAG: hypothetical protein CVU97_06615 [Firmicutes bacterium HGW-Firmicutes-21]
MIVTSPTYEGVVSDISAIAAITHEYSIPLFVDEAHGAHLGLSEHFPVNSIKAGADIVVHGLHKTLPAPTQSALLHINNSIVDWTEVQRQLAVFQTSSPSYILMAGIDSCIELLVRERDRLFADYDKRLNDFYDRMRELENIRILSSGNTFFSFDKGKILISVKNTDINGTQLKRALLDKYLLQLEMAMGDYALAMTSICDTDEGFLRLGGALLEIDATLNKVPEDENGNVPFGTPEVVMPSYEAESREGRFIPLSDSKNAVSREYIYAYPPGIPLLVPGERITERLISSINGLFAEGVPVKSCFLRLPEQINIVL